MSRWTTLGRRWLAGLAPCAVCADRAAGPDGICRTCTTLLWDGSARDEERLGSVALIHLGSFDGALRSVVHEIKFAGRARLAVVAGEHLGAAVAERGWPVARVVPVPLHPRRRRERGFDQADLIARGVSRVLGAPLWRGLSRGRATGRQARSSVEDRRRNVAGAFEARSLPRLPLVLVDDVWTTGATARACRTALIEAGAAEVRVAVLARSGRSGTAAPPPLERIAQR